MRHIIVLLILAGLAWHGYGKYQQSLVMKQQVVSETVQALPTERPSERPERPLSPDNSPSTLPSQSKAFQCDGRQHCSQMTSCEEANWFLRNCPNVKMDGDNDGNPCERGPC